MTRWAALVLVLAGCRAHQDQAKTMRDGLSGFDTVVAARLGAWLRGIGPGCEAVFDADGTLWRGDISETFFRELIQQRRFLDPALRDHPDLWADYQRRETRDAISAYRWLAQTLAGLPEATLQSWSREFATRWRARIYEPMRALVQQAQRRGCRVWIVTASQRWVVQAMAPSLGIAAAQVLGVDLRVERGVVTREVLQFPYAEQKVTVIDRLLGGRPSLAAGDSFADRFMIERSTDVKLCIGERGAPSKLLELASARGWLAQRF